MSRSQFLLSLFLGVAHLALSLTCLLVGLHLAGSGGERSVGELSRILGETLLLIFRGLTFPALLLARFGDGALARGALEWPVMALNALIYGVVGARLLRTPFQRWLDTIEVDRPRS